MNIDGSIYFVTVRDVGFWFGRGVGYEIYIAVVYNELYKGLNQ